MRVSKTQRYVLDRLINTSNTGLGSILPPPIRSGIQVPPIRNLQILSQEYNTVTLTWDEPEEIKQNVRQYNVFALDPRGNILLGPVAVSEPPVTLRFPVLDHTIDVVWAVQVELTALGRSEKSLVTIHGRLFPTYTHNVRVRRIDSSSTIDARANVYLVSAASGPVTITLPGSRPENSHLTIKKIDSSLNPVNIVPGISGETIDGSGSHSLTMFNQVARLISDSSGAWYLV